MSSFFGTALHWASKISTRKCGATNWTEFQWQQKLWLENSSPGFTGPALLLQCLFSTAVLTVIFSVLASPHPSTLCMKCSSAQTRPEPLWHSAGDVPFCIGHHPDTRTGPAAASQPCSRTALITTSRWESAERKETWWDSSRRMWWVASPQRNWNARSATVLTACQVDGPRFLSAAIVCVPSALQKSLI